jgi:N-carbamoyl-L-amino-acid hydrolase
VKGPTGRGLTRRQIIATFRRRLKNQPQDELLEGLRQVHRIAEIRLNALLGIELAFGPTIMDWAEQLGAISDDEDGLTCAYMTPAHQRTARQLAAWMADAGMDAHIDAAGNVVGRYAADDPARKPCSPVRTTTPCATAASTTGASASCCRWPS